MDKQTQHSHSSTSQYPTHDKPPQYPTSPYQPLYTSPYSTSPYQPSYSSPYQPSHLSPYSTSPHQQPLDPTLRYRPLKYEYSPFVVNQLPDDYYKTKSTVTDEPKMQQELNLYKQSTIGNCDCAKFDMFFDR